MGNGHKVVTGPLPALPLPLACSPPQVPTHPLNQVGSVMATFCIRSLHGALPRAGGDVPSSQVPVLFLRERAHPHRPQVPTHSLLGVCWPRAHPSGLTDRPYPFWPEAPATQGQEDPPLLPLKSSLSASPGQGLDFQPMYPPTGLQS